MIRLVLTFLAVAALGVGAATAFAGDDHGGCKGDPHQCTASTVVSTVTAPTQTVTVTAPTSSSSSSQASTGAVTVTVVVPPSKTSTVVKVRTKLLRRWCARSGYRGRWRCYPRRPAFIH